MGEDPWRRGFESDLADRQMAAQAHQKEREVLFGNEVFLIGVLQVVAGGSLFAGLSQTQALERLAGSLSFLGFITLMAAALVASVLAAYWKHEYKMWDVKAAASVAEGNHAEAKARARNTGKRLVAMRRAMLACVVLFIVGVGQLLAFAWTHALWPTTEKGAQTAASLTPSRAQPTNATAARPTGQRPAGCNQDERLTATKLSRFGNHGSPQRNTDPPARAAGQAVKLILGQVFGADPVHQVGRGSKRLFWLAVILPGAVAGCWQVMTESWPMRLEHQILGSGGIGCALRAA